MYGPLLKTVRVCCFVVQLSTLSNFFSKCLIFTNTSLDEHGRSLLPLSKIQMARVITLGRQHNHHSDA